MRDKLLEEVAEICQSHTRDEVVEEAADIIEVLVAIAAEHGATLDDILDIRRRKRLHRGGFEQRVWLD